MNNIPNSTSTIVDPLAHRKNSSVWAIVFVLAFALLAYVLYTGSYGNGANNTTGDTPITTTDTSVPNSTH